MMMELSHSLTLNEEALKELSASKKPIFVFEWLRFLDKVLEAANKADIKQCQKQLVGQLVNQMSELPGPPTQKLIAKSLATLFSIGDTFLLFETVNKCIDILKNKDDSASYLATRLAAVACIGAMYGKLGRMMGRSYEETVQILVKAFKNSESQLRIEIMVTLQKITEGMGTAASNVHKDIYKAAKIGLTDRALPVRSASACCLLELCKNAPFLYTTVVETLSQLCFRSFDNANYDVRCSVSRFLGILLATTQNPPKEFMKNLKSNSVKLLSLEESLNILLNGFLRGNSSFLKGTGEMIKGSSSVSREIRVGITQAYVSFAHEMGALWLERNLSIWLNHLIEVVTSPKATGSHVEAVYTRKCVSFIMRSTIGKMLGEKAQSAACKELVALIIRSMNSLDLNGEAKDAGEGSQHSLICLLQELGCLIESLSTTSSPLILDPQLNVVDAVVSVLLHPTTATRLAAAWCLRCVCVALPSQLHPLITRCCDKLESLKSSPEAILGYSSVVTAVVGSVRETTLGVPHRTGKELFNIAEELLRSASQNSRLSVHKTHAGWLIIGSIMTLGTGVVRGLLPRMLLLWKNSFPRSSKEIESEKARGDAFTWQVTLEGRSGALSSMHSFLYFCPSLAADDTIRRLLLPIEAALLMLSSIANIVKQYGNHLKASTAMVRLRLYEVLSLLPQASYESHYTAILKLLVSEFTLADSSSNTTTSLLRTVCHSDDSVILGSWLHETDHDFIEEQLQPNSASGSGALEHDSCYLYRPLKEDQHSPGPLPLGVAVIDASVILFGKMFPFVANKHRLKMLNLFGDMVRAGKNQRQESVQTNIFTAVLSALRGLSEQKCAFGQEDVKKAAADLVLGGLTHPNPMLRCASGEAIGRMAQVVGDPRFVADMAQNSFDKLKNARDAVSRTGHSLALGCLHRYVGGMGSGQHLNTSISILLALAKDTTSPSVQVWSLHALSLIADSGGPMFRTYVEPSLALLLELLLSVPPHSIEVHQCIAKCLQALITTVGPELQGTNNAVVMARWSLLCGCGLIQQHHDPIIQSEAITCLQQMHMFAPRHVNLSSLVPVLVKKINSSHLLLRRAVVSCVRQLSQREAWEVCEHAITLSSDADESPSALVMTDTGLPGLLFGLLDAETDVKLVQHIHCTLTSMLQVLSTSHLSLWITLCREVLTSAIDSGEIEGENGMEEGDDDMAQFQASSEPDPYPTIPPRWTTRVFAAQCVVRIIKECEGNRAHFDMALAKEMQTTKMKGDFLVLHLSELIRMGFMAATSDCDELRLEGLDIMSMIIDKFATSLDPEFPDHVILEQYQAQVGAALRPAFATETASHVTAKACEVCSAWIGSGVAQDLNDLRRVHQLLVSSLAKLKKGNAKGVYNERAMTLEKLAILKAWAEVYIVAVNTGKKDFSEREESLLSLVTPELVSLSTYWLAALKDFALLSLPPEFSSQLPHDGGAFYTNETADDVRGYYRSSWPPILFAVALWLSDKGFDTDPREISPQTEDNHFASKISAITLNQRPSNGEIKSIDDINSERFYLLLGICLQWLCSPSHTEDPDRSVTCMKALKTLLLSDLPSLKIGKNSSLSTEVAAVMHRTILSSDHVEVHQTAIDVVSLIVKANQSRLDDQKRQHNKDGDTKDNDDADLLGEGEETGEINTSQSLVYTALQVCLCALVRHLPSIAPQVVSSAPSLLAPPRIHVKSQQLDKLCSTILLLLSRLPDLCSPAGGVAILPSTIYLLTGVLRECSKKGKLHFDITYGDLLKETPILKATLNALASVSSHKYSRDPRSSNEWCTVLQSALVTTIGLSKSLDGDIDEVVVLRGITEIILNSPPFVSKPHNLQYPIINLFKMTLQHDNIQVRMQCVDLLNRVFKHYNKEIAVPYIHALAPNILEYMSDFKNSIDSETDYELFIKSGEAIESLVPRTIPEYKSDLIGLLVSIMVGVLLDNDSIQSSHSVSLKLHKYALNQLQKIGPMYPVEFRSILSSEPNLKMKLEAAIKSEHEISRRNEPLPATLNTPIKPTITLKTDFSNFSKS